MENTYYDETTGASYQIIKDDCETEEVISLREAEQITKTKNLFRRLCDGAVIGTNGINIFAKRLNNFEF